MLWCVLHDLLNSFVRFGVQTLFTVEIFTTFILGQAPFVLIEIGQNLEDCVFFHARRGAEKKGLEVNTSIVVSVP